MVASVEDGALCDFGTVRHVHPEHAIVWVGLAILLAVGAFAWLFVLGHGFNYPF